MKLPLKSGTFLLAGELLIALFETCKKNSDILFADSETAQDATYLVCVYNDVVNAVDVSAKNQGSLTGTLDMLTGNLIKITIDSTGNVKTLTMDFGTGVTCKDAKVRSGQIIATWPGLYSNPFTNISISLKNYIVNGDKVEGTITLTNYGLNSSGNYKSHIEILGGDISTQKGAIHWFSQYEREWVEGSNTTAISDDIYYIYPDGNGIAANGNRFSFSGRSALVNKLNCEYIVAGWCLLATEDNITIGRVVFGDSTCDNLATFTDRNNGKDYDFPMR
jgi:hypothetical protein